MATGIHISIVRQGFLCECTGRVETHPQRKHRNVLYWCGGTRDQICSLVLPGELTAFENRARDKGRRMKDAYQCMIQEGSLPSSTSRCTRLGMLSNCCMHSSYSSRVMSVIHSVYESSCSCAANPDGACGGGMNGVSNRIIRRQGRYRIQNGAGKRHPLPFAQPKGLTRRSCQSDSCAL